MRISMFLLGLLAATPAAADEFRLHPLFSNGVVLQRGQPIRVWGAGHNGRSVTVSFGGNTVTTRVEADRWTAELPAVAAGGPYQLHVQGDSDIRVDDVLVGEVFVCSGQSNMEWPLHLTEASEQALAQRENDPQLRLLHIQHAIADAPREDFDSAGWQSARPETLQRFSAVAYHFGRTLRKSQQVPVGLIQATWSGTLAEGWTSREAIERQPALQSVLQHAAGAVPGDPNYAGRLFNGLIAPLVKFPIGGVLWYQGEANVDRHEQYRVLLPTLIQDWRNRWGRPDLPFLFVQLAPFGTPSPQPQESNWAALREVQREVSEIVPNTAMVVITDAGDADIHPPRKQIVGERLARAALNLIYGQPGDWRGPHMVRAERRDRGVWLTFDRIGQGLRVHGPLSGFTLAGTDGVHHPAFAQIRGANAIEVTSAEVPSPVTVRYGWDSYPVVNLASSENLPTSPFQARVTGP